MLLKDYIADSRFTWIFILQYNPIVRYNNVTKCHCVLLVESCCRCTRTESTPGIPCLWRVATHRHVLGLRVHPPPPVPPACRELLHIVMYWD